MASTLVLTKELLERFIDALSGKLEEGIYLGADVVVTNEVISETVVRDGFEKHVHVGERIVIEIGKRHVAVKKEAKS
jgi:hypothetical protein